MEDFDEKEFGIECSIAICQEKTVNKGGVTVSKHTMQVVRDALLRTAYMSRKF